MSWYKLGQLNTFISPSEKIWFDWAIDPMYEYWCSESGAWERDGDIYKEIQLPKVVGLNLFVSPVPEINEDLLYRLEEQAVDVSQTDSSSVQQESARSRSALSLAKKIREII